MVCLSLVKWIHSTWKKYSLWIWNTFFLRRCYRSPSFAAFFQQSCYSSSQNEEPIILASGHRPRWFEKPPIIDWKKCKFCENAVKNPVATNFAGDNGGYHVAQFNAFHAEAKRVSIDCFLCKAQEFQKAHPWYNCQSWAFLVKKLAIFLFRPQYLEKVGDSIKPNLIDRILSWDSSTIDIQINSSIVLSWQCH